MNVESELRKAINSKDANRIRAAFQRLYNENVRLVYRVLIDSFGKDDGTDDDIQQAFLAMLQSTERLASVDRIVDYWIQTAKYICTHRRTYEQRSEVLEEETQSVGRTIPELVQEDEFFAQVQGWLGHPDADIVILRAAYGYSEKEIAVRIGLSEDSVSYRYRKGIKELKRRLKK